MVRAKDITVCYAVTPDLPYPRCAAASIYSAVRATEGVRLRLVEVDGGDYPWGVMPQVLRADFPTDWVIVLNADTWVNDDLRKLIPDGEYDLRLRVSRAWGSDRIGKRKWYDILHHFDLPFGPVYSNNLIVCRASVARQLQRVLPLWTRAIVECGLPDPLNRKLIKKSVPEWWMRDQFALSAYLASWPWRVNLLSRRELSWNFAREKGGIVHHLGTDVDPFGEKQWPTYAAT